MSSSQFSLESYDFSLPSGLIAQVPVQPRDASRLLVVDRGRGRWEHRRFSDLPEFVDAQDLLVANNTRVLKARLLGHRLLEGPTGREERGGKIEFLLLEELRPRVWEGMFHAAAKHKPGVRFEIPTPDGKGLRGTLVRGASESPNGTVVAELDRDPIESGAGVVPLPPYIDWDARAVTAWPADPSAARAGIGPRRNPAMDGAIEALHERGYQTIYAKEFGASAAPTAGLHFTSEVLEKIRAKGARWAEITLHVGLGTFRPVKEEDVRRHVMHEERYDISQETADEVNAAKRDGRRVLAVGTTSVRTLEGAWTQRLGQPGELPAGGGRTSIFIYPGASTAQFKVVDRLLTNFHLPKSTLLMLICAFAGRDLTLAAYADAVKERYRFFSYGDAMLIL